MLRSMEENYGEQVSTKRLKWNCEESPEESRSQASAPSKAGDTA